MMSYKSTVSVTLTSVQASDTFLFIKCWSLEIRWVWTNGVRTSVVLGPVLSRSSHSMSLKCIMRMQATCFVSIQSCPGFCRGVLPAVIICRYSTSMVIDVGQWW